MSDIPSNLKYTSEHEWLKDLGDGTALVGITEHAQAELGDITFVELPAVGASLERGAPFGVVESVKAASDLYAPVSGEVLEINGGLESAPESVNQSPYEKGWMLKVKLSDASQTAALLDAAAYAALLG